MRQGKYNFTRKTGYEFIRQHNLAHSGRPVNSHTLLAERAADVYYHYRHTFRKDAFPLGRLGVVAFWKGSRVVGLQPVLKDNKRATAPLCH